MFSSSSPPRPKRKAPSTSTPERSTKRAGPSINDIPSSADSTLLRVPPRLMHIRRAVFLLQETIGWSAEQFDQCWPFMDNFWVLDQTRQITKKHTVASYWYCRLWAGPGASEGSGKKAKKLRRAESCRMKLKMVKQFSSINPDILLSVSLSLHQDKKDENQCFEHNHTLEYIDHITLNSFIQTTAADLIEHGYAPASIKQILTGIKYPVNAIALFEAGGKRVTLNDIHNAGHAWQSKNPDIRIQGARELWQEQLDSCLTFLTKQKDVYSANISVKRKVDGQMGHGIIFATAGRILTLRRRGHLAIMDSAHHTNSLKWFLFTVMVRDESGKWIPCAHMLSQYEDGDIIREFLKVIRRWSGGPEGWRLRYFITGDSAAEQRGVRGAFQGSKEGTTEVSHFLCRKHSERTLKRNLGAQDCKAAYQHIYSALYFKHTKMGCEQSIEAAIQEGPPRERDYIRREWWETRQNWAYYARQHSCLLLQCMTTNAVETWHNSIKSAANGEAAMVKFSLSGCASHILRIGDQWEHRAHATAINFRTTCLPECSEEPALLKFPEPVQRLIVEQRRKGLELADEGELPKYELSDDLVCTCLFYRQYQLPCAHLWQYHTMSGVFNESHWGKWAYMFEDCGFEVYEGTTKTYQISEICNAIDGPSRQMLEVREVLDNIEAKFSEIEELTSTMDQDVRRFWGNKWVDLLRMLTGDIRRRGAEQALEELRAEGHRPEEMELAAGWRASSDGYRSEDEG
ncbi:hypothetical protein N7G274_001171 [Stereocaulon virgatum]|uniref:SWIM-type domain-containing protein n=1 Tax=Stereocaulon virgatum TaxID=373712 RepID=A0ABR4AN40_9LECA